MPYRAWPCAAVRGWHVPARARQGTLTYGAKPEHYAVVGSALLWTLEKGLGSAWTSEVASAWTAAYGTLSDFMIAEAYGHPSTR